MTGLRQVAAVLFKDLLLGWRGRVRFVSVVLFGVVTLLLFSFALGPDSQALRAGAAGFLVLALLLSSTLSLSESFRLEQEDQAMEGLLLAPIDPVALFYGKALANTAFLLLLAPILAPAAVALYSLTPTVGGLVRLAALWALVAGGLSAPGTLYAAMTSRTRSEDVLLPLLLYPLVVPVLLAAVKGLDLVLNGDPMRQLGGWSQLLAAFNLIYWALGGLLFSRALEDS